MIFGSYHQSLQMERKMDIWWRKIHTEREKARSERQESSVLTWSEQMCRRSRKYRSYCIHMKGAFDEGSYERTWYIVAHTLGKWAPDGPARCGLREHICMFQPFPLKSPHLVIIYLWRLMSASGLLRNFKYAFPDRAYQSIRESARFPGRSEQLYDFWYSFFYIWLLDAPNPCPYRYLPLVRLLCIWASTYNWLWCFTLFDFTCMQYYIHPAAFPFC